MLDHVKLIDAADGQEWSEGDLWDLRNSLEHGRSIEEVAGFLCRSGTVDEVRRKAQELGLVETADRREHAPAD
jgi:hypothetical protein